MEINFGLNIKVIKTKKAAMIGQNCKSQEQIYGSKFGAPTLLMTNINTPHPIQDRITENNSFKAHKVSQKDESCITTKNGIEYIQCNILLPLFYISTIF